MKVSEKEGFSSQSKKADKNDKKKDSNVFFYHFKTCIPFQGNLTGLFRVNYIRRSKHWDPRFY